MIVARLALWLLLLGVGWFTPPPPAVAEIAPPRLVAHWERPGVARLVWHEPGGVGVTCLSRNAILIRCWNNLPAEHYIMLLGATGSLDGAYRPTVGDTFVLQQDSTVFRAKLEGVVYLPTFRG